MRLLLDTHILVWALMEDTLLPDQAAMLINDDCNELFSARFLYGKQLSKMESGLIILKCLMKG